MRTPANANIFLILKEHEPARRGVRSFASVNFDLYCCEMSGVPRGHYTVQSELLHLWGHGVSVEMIQSGRKTSEEGEASRPSPTASFRSVPRRSPSSNFANLVARTTILAILFRRIHTPDTVDTLTPAISPAAEEIFQNEEPTISASICSHL